MVPCCGRLAEMNMVGYPIPHPMCPLRNHHGVSALVG